MKNWRANPSTRSAASLLCKSGAERHARRFTDAATASLVVLAVFFASGFPRATARGDANESATVRVSTIDGADFSAEWLSADERGIELRAHGGTRRYAHDEFMTIRFDQRPEPPRGAAMIHLADGGRLPGDLAGDAPDAVIARTRLSDQTSLPFAQLAGLRLAAVEEFPRAARLFDDALSSRLPGQDVLITRSTDDAKSLRGRLININSERGAFEFGGRERTFQLDRIFGVVFAAGVAASAIKPLTVRLADDSEFTGTLISADTEAISVAPSFGGQSRVPLNLLRELRFRSDRVVYLSDLTSVTERTEGRLHRAWPVMRDRNVSGGPISLGQVHYNKGLGVHSRSELVFDLEGRFSEFVADVGIDDRVRPRGTVVFRVLGDDRVLFDSGLRAGTDAALPVRISVKGIDRLTLLVDYGDELDYGDQANWAGARLLLPPPPNTEGGPTQ